MGTAKYYLWVGEGPEQLTAFRMGAIVLEIEWPNDKLDLALGSFDFWRSKKVLDGLNERTHVKGVYFTEIKLSPDEQWLAFREKYKVWLMPAVRAGRLAGPAPDYESAQLMVS